MEESELNALKIKLIRWICDIEGEAILQKLLDIMNEAKEKG